MRKLIKQAGFGTAAIGVFSAASAYAASPTVYIATAPLIDPASAISYYGSPTSPAPASRQALVNETARALRYDVDTIFNYVRDNIEYTPLFGLQGGARGVILNGRGTAFDQAQFLVDLLREADAKASKGYNPRYQAGRIQLSSADFAAWTGISDAALASRFLANGGIPATVSGSGSSFTVTMIHCWVKVTIAGTDYLFDPGLKPSTATAGLGWSSATGYSQSGLLASAGGSQGSTAVSGFNIANFRSTLTSYRANLESYLSANAAGKRGEVVVGYRTITPHDPSENRRTALPYVLSTDWTWSGQVPDVFRTSFTVALNGDPYGTYFADEIGGEAWQFGYQYTGSAFVKSGTPAGPVVTGYILNNCDNYLSNRTAVAPAIATVAINHPYAASSGAYADRTISRQLTALKCNNGSFYLTNDWGYVGDGIMRRLSPIANNTRFDTTNASLFTLSTTLAGIPSQYASFLNLAGPALNANFLVHDVVGLHVLDNVSLKLATGSSFSTSSLATALSMDFEAAVSAMSLGGTTTGDTGAAYVAGLGLSYAEGAVPRQETDSVYDMAAVNLLAEQDGRAPSPGTYNNYLATPATWGSVQSSLSGYPSGAIGAMSGYVGEGFSLLAPQQGALRQPQITIASAATRTSSLWEGVGPGSTEAEVRRSTFLAWHPSGGSGSVPDRISLVLFDQRRGSILKAGVGVPIVADSSGALIRKPELPKIEGKDFIRAALNVDGRTGAVTYAPAADITDGTGDFPRSLSLQRQYDLRDQTNYGFGSGWKHNWYQVATMSNDGQAALGMAGAQASASALVAFQAINDLTTTQDAQHLYAGLQVLAWLAQQTLNNTVVIARGFDSEQTFYRQADGTSFVNSKPDGSTFSLSGGPAVGIINRFIYAGISGAYTDNTGARRNYAIANLPPGTDLSSPGIASGWTRKSAYMTDWTFANGIKIWADYQATLLVPDMVYLYRVRNNLGNAIYLGNSPGYDPGSFTPFYYCDTKGGPILQKDPWSGQMQYQRSDGTSVRFWVDPQVGYTLLPVDGEIPTNCPPESTDPAVSRFQLLSSLRSVSDMTNKSWRYDYTSANNMFGNVSGLSGIYKPSNSSPDVLVTYGNDTNGRTFTNLRGNSWSYYSTSFRSEVVSPVQTGSGGTGASVYFDRYAQAIRSVDPLGRATLTAYDDRGRPFRVTKPEGNSTITAYDARGNPIQQTEKPKPGSPLADRITYATYMESGTSLSCANLKTCNKPSYTIDALGHRANYGWDSGSGELTSVSKGWNAAGTTCLVSGGTCPTTTYGYGSGIAGYDPVSGGASGTIFLPLGKTETISPGISRTTAFGYTLRSYAPATYGGALSSATVKKIVPTEMTLDAGGLSLRHCYAYDTTGNMTSTTEPRALASSCQ